MIAFDILFAIITATIHKFMFSYLPETLIYIYTSMIIIGYVLKDNPFPKPNLNQVMDVTNTSFSVTVDPESRFPDKAHFIY